MRDTNKHLLRFILCSGELKTFHLTMLLFYFANYMYCAATEYY